VSRRERFGRDLVHLVAARWLALDDPADALDRVGVVDPIPLMADSLHGGSVR
jgi:hypothetical protein